MERVHRSGAIWAFLAAAGAAYLVTGLALVVRELALPPARQLETAITNNTLYFGGVADPILMTLAVCCGTFAAGHIGRRAGGGRTVALYAGFLTLAGSFIVAGAFDRERLVRSDPSFYIVTLYDMPLTAAVIAAVPVLTCAIGALVAHGRAVVDGRNAALEAAGAYAIVAVFGVMAAGLPVWRHLLVAPYASIALDSAPHVAIAAAQIVVAAVIFAFRRPVAQVSRSLMLFAIVGAAGVAHADAGALLGVVFYHHTYVPLSLILVPLASALAATLIVFGLRIQFRSRVALP